ncbi:MAG: YigZ family protein [Acholeplasmatales bacterium]|nr:YigZ family protein [Acholeplasmatales bacterium]
MKTIKEIYNNELIIKKSKFITNIYPVKDEDMCKDILKDIRKKYYDATHNCYAYIIGDMIMKSSDDGEPAKTAGMPMLEALKDRELTNVLVIVTRYFGGTLLGKPGLIKAYRDSVYEIINKCNIYNIIDGEKYRINLSYEEYNNLTKLSFINIITSSFTNDVIVDFKIKSDEKDTLIDKLEKNKIRTNSLSYLEKCYFEELI